MSKLLKRHAVSLLEI